MSLIKKAIFIIIGLIFVLIIGQIVSSVNSDLNRIFSENSIFNITGPLTLILLTLLGLGLTVGIILNTIKRDEPKPVPFKRMSRFEDFEE